MNMVENQLILIRYGSKQPNKHDIDKHLSIPIQYERTATSFKSVVTFRYIFINAEKIVTVQYF